MFFRYVNGNWLDNTEIPADEGRWGSFNELRKDNNEMVLSILIRKGFDIYCGFDSDETGDSTANRMILLYPTVKRLRPNKHDWNEVLLSKSVLH